MCKLGLRFFYFVINISTSGLNLKPLCILRVVRMKQVTVKNFSFGQSTPLMVSSENRLEEYQFSKVLYLRHNNLTCMCSIFPTNMREGLLKPSLFDGISFCCWVKHKSLNTVQFWAWFLPYILPTGVCLVWWGLLVCSLMFCFKIQEDAHFLFRSKTENEIIIIGSADDGGFSFSPWLVSDAHVRIMSKLF